MLHFSGLHLILVTKSVLSHFCFIAENQRIKRLRRVKQNKAEKGKIENNKQDFNLSQPHSSSRNLPHQTEGQKQEYANNSLSRGKTRWAVKSLEPHRARTDTESHRAAVICKKKQCRQF